MTLILASLAAALAIYVIVYGTCADLTITAANLVPGANAQYGVAIAAVTITQGQVVYLNGSNQLALANNTTSLATATVVGIAVDSVLAGQPCMYQVGGVLAFGAILTAGHFYVLSQNNGGITDSTNLTSTWRSSLLGYALTTSNLQVQIVNTGVTLA